MKNIKMTIAAVLAATFASNAMATDVPGLPSGVFEFSQPGIQTMPTSGDGLDAIANIEDILSSVGSTGGSKIDLDEFWSAFVADTQTNVFEYGKAKGMIEELIFTVTGEIYVGAGSSNEDSFGYRKATDFSSLGGVDEVAVQTAKNSHTTGGGVYVDGKLSDTKDAAIALLSSLGLSQTGTLLVTNATAGTTAVSNNEVAAAAAAGNVSTAVAAASINKSGFDNANELIALIANQLKTGFILDASAASEAVQEIANQHNGYLGARIVHDAKSIKNIIHAIGIQEAGVGVGKGAEVACRGVVAGVANTNDSLACTTVGSQFKDLISDLPAAGSDLAGDYTAILASIDAIVTSVVAFNDENSPLDGYVSTDASDAIDTQFGTITVVRDVDSNDVATVGSLYENLTDSDTTNNPDLADATDNSLVTIPTGFTFDGSVTIGTEDLFSF